ncbi:mucin-6 [Grus japonensis]|uniref:Mucin-6 n=1 Tax=Grus japonensis TaxID=30415 RepID=A0ABC9WX95_GRUJA
MDTNGFMTKEYGRIHILMKEKMYVLKQKTQYRKLYEYTLPCCTVNGTTEENDVESLEVKGGDDVVRVVVNVVVRKEVLSTDSVEAEVITPGATVVVVDKTVGIKTGVDLAEMVEGTNKEDVLPRGVNVVFWDEKFVVLSADLNVEVARGTDVGTVLAVGAKREENVEVVADGSLVLRGLLGGGGE